MLSALALLACSAGKTGDDTSANRDSGLPADRGPTTVVVDGDPNGLWWSDGVLSIADDDNNRVLQWTDATGIGLVGNLPDASADGAGLGQLVALGEGTIVVTRFGYGTAGDVVTLGSDGSGEVVPNLDVERRRIGLTVADDGTLYDGWFNSGHAGAVSILDLSGSEIDVMSGLGKVVGVLAVGDTLYVSDQDAGEVFSAPIAHPSDVSVFAQVDSPDLLCAGPDGSLFTGGSGGDVRQIGADGSVNTLSTGYQEVRGVAYDADNERLFVVDHDADDSDGTTNFLQIIPVD